MCVKGLHGPDRQMRGDISKGPADKKEMRFSTTEPSKKEKKMDNIASYSRPTKQRRNFQTGR